MRIWCPWLTWSLKWPQWETDSQELRDDSSSTTSDLSAILVSLETPFHLASGKCFLALFFLCWLLLLTLFGWFPFITSIYYSQSSPGLSIWATSFLLYHMYSLGDLIHSHIFQTISILIIPKCISLTQTLLWSSRLLLICLFDISTLRSIAEAFEVLLPGNIISLSQTNFYKNSQKKRKHYKCTLSKSKLLNLPG